MQDIDCVCLGIYSHARSTERSLFCIFHASRIALVTMVVAIIR